MAALGDPVRAPEAVGPELEFEHAIAASATIPTNAREPLNFKALRVLP